MALFRGGIAGPVCAQLQSQRREFRRQGNTEGTGDPGDSKGGQIWKALLRWSMMKGIIMQEPEKYFSGSLEVI